MTPSYYIGRCLCRFFLFLLGGYKGVGAENIPKEGPVLLMPNHVSYLDPPAAGSCCSRQVYFMAKAELFKIPALGKLIYSVGAFPVTRGTSDVGAIKHAFRLLKEGRMVNIFPEGRRSKDGLLGEPQRGALMVAIKSDAVLIPTAIKGTDKCLSTLNKGLHRTKTTVRYGRPLKRDDLEGLDSHEACRILGERWTEAMEELMKN